MRERLGGCETALEDCSKIVDVPLQGHQGRDAGPEFRIGARFMAAVPAFPCFPREVAEWLDVSNPEVSRFVGRDAVVT